MKKLLTGLMCGIFLISLGGNLAAVEKKDKKSPQKEVVQNKQTTPQKSTLRPKSAGKQTPQKRYDTFIDQNKNGIDDRQENLKAKPVAKTTKKVEEKKK
jgi:hypothetical protein